VIRRRDDVGASMVLVLIVVVMAALVSTAFLTKSRTELRASSVLQTKTQLSLGADAGLEKGIQALRDDLASAARTKCLTPFEPETALSPPFPWNGSAATVSTSCLDLQGVAASAQGNPLYSAAIITTGGDHSLTSNNSANSAIDIGGPVYVSGIESASPGSGDLQKDVHLSYGDFSMLGCTTPPDLSAKLTVTPPYGVVCTKVTAADGAPTLSLPSLPPGAPSYFDVTPSCRIFFPGSYTSAPALLTNNGNTPTNTGNRNYFASGTYYFAPSGGGALTFGIGTNDVVVAGRKAASFDSDLPVPNGNGNGGGTTNVAPCTDDTAAIAHLTAVGLATTIIGGTGGAQFLFGGDSQLNIQGTLVMYSPPAQGSKPPVNVYTIRAGDATSPATWAPWTGHLQSGAVQPLLTGGSATQELFNGALNAFDAPIAIFATNNTVAAVRAGIVAKTLDLAASTQGGGLDVAGFGGADSTNGSRILRVSSKATGLTNEGGIMAGVAIVEVPNDGSPPTVRSWRLE
jgi:Tfp pilus assembly protein PilX